LSNEACKSEPSAKYPWLRLDFILNPPSDSASLKAWEEENAEYASWNLIDDEKDTASC